MRILYINGGVAKHYAGGGGLKLYLKATFEKRDTRNHYILLDQVQGVTVIIIDYRLQVDLNDYLKLLYC